MPILLGIDPGAKNTGICVVDNTIVLHSETILTEDMITAIKRVCEIITTYRPEHVYIEDVNSPSWFYERQGAALKPEYVIATAKKIGAITATCHHYEIECTIVPPNNHGYNILASYPVELISERLRKNPQWRMKKSTKDSLQHQRAAFDVIKTGVFYQKAEKKLSRK